MRKTILKLLLTSSLIISGLNHSAYAADNSGAYINLNAGFGSGLSAPEVAFIPVQGAGYSLNAGYNFNNYIAAEGGYTKYAGGFFSAADGANFFDLAAKGSLPLGNTFSLYGRLGLAYQTIQQSIFSSDKQKQIIGLIGIGAAFKISKHLEIHVDDTYFPQFTSNITYTNVNLFSGGLQINF